VETGRNGMNLDVGRATAAEGAVRAGRKGGAHKDPLEFSKVKFDQ